MKSGKKPRRPVKSWLWLVRIKRTLRYSTWLTGLLLAEESVLETNAIDIKAAGDKGMTASAGRPAAAEWETLARGDCRSAPRHRFTGPDRRYLRSGSVGKWIESPQAARPVGSAGGGV